MECLNYLDAMVLKCDKRRDYQQSRNSNAGNGKNGVNKKGFFTELVELTYGV